MKKIIFLLSIALFIGACKSESKGDAECCSEKKTAEDECSSENKTAEVKTANIGETISSKFIITGMFSKEHCSSSIQKKLQELEGVTNVSLDFETKTLTLQHNEKITSDIIISTITSLNDAYKVEQATN